MSAPDSPARGREYVPPFWSLKQFGEPEGDWKDLSLKKKMRDNGVPPSRVKTLEQLLRKAVLDATPIIQNGPAGKGQMRQQEPKAVLLRELQKADPVPRTGKISIDKFNKVLERRFHFNLTVSEAQAIFAKYGFVKESEKWRMPYAMFCARLFSARGHIVSMAGTRDGAMRVDQPESLTFRGQFKYRPCKKGVTAPSDWTKQDSLRSAKKPEAYLEMEFVYGYSGLYNTSPNLFYLNQEEVVYYTAGIGIVYTKAKDGEPHKQRFFMGHDDDICCLGVHPDRESGIIATGQLGKYPKVIIWNAFTMKELARVEFLDGGSRRVTAVTFSIDGNQLLCVACDNGHTITEWEWAKARDKKQRMCYFRDDQKVPKEFAESMKPNFAVVGFQGTPPQVFGVAYRPGDDGSFASWGVKHFKVWTENEPKLDETGAVVKGEHPGVTGKAGGFGGLAMNRAEIQHTLCCAWIQVAKHADPENPYEVKKIEPGSKEHVVPINFTGTPKGELYIWGKDGDSPKVVACIKLHPGELRVIELKDDGKTILTGGSDMKVKEWDISGLSAIMQELEVDGGKWLGRIDKSKENSDGSGKPEGPMAGGLLDNAFVLIDEDECVEDHEQGVAADQMNLADEDEEEGDDGPVFDAKKEEEKAKKFEHLKPCITGLDSYGTWDTFIAGTSTNDIWEIDEDPSVLVEGHHSDLYGLCCHPTDPGVFATACEDGCIYLWNATTFGRKEVNGCFRVGMKDPTTKKQIWYKPRACSFDEDGRMLAVSTLEGAIVVYDTGGLEENGLDDGDILAVFHDCVEAIDDLKFSPDGDLLAAGSHDNFIDVYQVGSLPSDEAQVAWKRKCRCVGHSSYITHLDWSKDGKVLQSNSGDYEILYWDMERLGKQVTLNQRDQNWVSWTCVLGFPVMGIWPDGSDGTDCNAVDASNNRKFVVTADDKGLVKLFAYPCVIDDAPFRGFGGHSSHVMNVRMSVNDRWVMSVGGKDRALIQWRTHGVRKPSERVSKSKAKGRAGGGNLLGGPAEPEPEPEARSSFKSGAAANERAQPEAEVELELKVRALEADLEKQNKKYKDSKKENKRLSATIAKMQDQLEEAGIDAPEGDVEASIEIE